MKKLTRCPRGKAGTHLPQLDRRLDDLDWALQALEEMVWQFAYRGVSQGRRALYTGGLSALECAFAALGWEEPHVVDPDDAPGCDEPGCLEWAEAFMGPDGRWCWKHGKQKATDAAR